MAKKILNRDIVDIIKHPKKNNQFILIIEIDNYIYAVPFLFDENKNIFLKTIYPSRKLNKKYKEGDKKDE